MLLRWDTAVSMTDCRLDVLEVGVRDPVGVRFSFSASSRPVLGPTQWLPWSLYLRCESDHLEGQEYSDLYIRYPIHLDGIMPRR
jgi:hypothetical protein